MMNVSNLEEALLLTVATAAPTASLATAAPTASLPYGAVEPPPDFQLSSPEDAQILRNSFMVYGIALLISFNLFCFVRLHFPRPYTLRRWVEKLKTHLADDSYGYVSWVWHLYMLTDDELLEHCGMDALCFLRVLRMGCKVSVVGICNSFWLFAVYATAPASPETEYITDGVILISIANIPSSSPRFVYTTISCYVIFGYTMYLILKEFDWFFEKRHKFLMSRKARNYAIFVRNIPPEFQSNAALKAFFVQSLSPNSVLESNILVRCPVLGKLVARRQNVINKLETAIYIKEKTGLDPSHAKGMIGFIPGVDFIPGVSQIDSITFFTEELKKLNQEVRERIEATENVHAMNDQKMDLMMSQTNGDLEVAASVINSPINKRADPISTEIDPSFTTARTNLVSTEIDPSFTTARTNLVSTDINPSFIFNTTNPESGEINPSFTTATTDQVFTKINPSIGDDSSDSSSSPVLREKEKINYSDESNGRESNMFQKITTTAAGTAMKIATSATDGAKIIATKTTDSAKIIASKTTDGAKIIASKTADGAKIIVTKTADGATKVVQFSADTAKDTAALAVQGATKALNMIGVGLEDGELLSAGFVSFTNINAVAASLQMVQTDQPFDMEVMEAPDPWDIYWSNVSRTHKDLQIGMIISLAATAALCLFWTVPMSFLSSISSVQGLREIIPNLDSILNQAPYLEPFLQVIGPLLVVILDSILPEILMALSKMEGPVSQAVVMASTFGKLAVFRIIQTFFVAILSGSVVSQLSNIVKDPGQLINFLAISLSTRSTYFIQISFVKAVISGGMEVLRVTPLIHALLRRFVGPRTTEKERQQKFLFVRPLAEPLEFRNFDNLSQQVLFFMVLLVYGALSPIVCYSHTLCFLHMSALYRHQFVYIYPTSPDSGGKMWISFIKVLMVCMLIAEVTIIGLLGLKKASIAASLMVPLIILTMLFNAYIYQKHFRVAEYLPARSSARADRRNGPNFDLSFVKDAYVQPELKDREAFPDVDDDILMQLFGRSRPSEYFESVYTDQFFDPVDPSELEEFNE